MANIPLSPFSICVLVPVYNHAESLPTSIAAIQRYQANIIIVDDGSDLKCRQVIKQLCRDYPEIILLIRPENGGKGAAVKDGLRMALSQGFSHALQIDADGQHNIQDIPRFLNAAKNNPKALVAGYPRYDESVPKHRYYARYATHVWVWINTLSKTIKDSMCGFRVYPLQQSCQLLDKRSMGDRMDFDVEFMVHWYWQAWPLKQLETQVLYSEDGISHFRLLADNGLISMMHAKLFCVMLLRLPLLLTKKLLR